MEDLRKCISSVVSSMCDDGFTMRWLAGTYPGPGHYSPGAERALFGPTLLKEGGGAVTRPGKSCLGTSASEGVIPGQHVDAKNARGMAKPQTHMLSHFNVVGEEGPRTVKGSWRKSPPRGNDYLSPYAIHTKKEAHVIYRKAGRIADATVTDHANIYRGKGSAGAFMRFPASRQYSK